MHWIIEREIHITFDCQSMALLCVCSHFDNSTQMEQYLSFYGKNSIQSKFYWFEWLFNRNWGNLFLCKLDLKRYFYVIFLNIIHIDAVEYFASRLIDCELIVI